MLHDPLTRRCIDYLATGFGESVPAFFGARLYPSARLVEPAEAISAHSCSRRRKRLKARFRQQRADITARLRALGRR